MAYRIDYGPPIKLPHEKENRATRLRVMTASCLLAFAIGVRLAWPAGASTLRRVLMPDYASHTQVVFQEMIDRIRSGETTVEAATAFCREVIEYGQTCD